MEKWIDIIGFEGQYQISNYGNIYSVKSKKMLGKSLGTSGYKNVCLCKNGFAKTYMIHRLVAKHFLPNPENLEQVNHKDHDKGNNNAENLEWVSQSENVKHSYLNPDRKKSTGWKGKEGAAHNRSKAIYEFNETGELLNTYESGLDFQRKTGIHHSSPSWAIKTGKAIYGKYYRRTKEFTEMKPENNTIESFARCESCGNGKVKRTIKELKNGTTSVKINNCTMCKRSYGIKGFENLEPLATTLK